MINVKVLLKIYIDKLASEKGGVFGVRGLIDRNTKNIKGVIE